MATKQQYAIGLTIAAAVVFISAFMAWGTLRNAQVNFPNVQFNGPEFGSPFGRDMNPAAMFGGQMPGIRLDITMTGWNGQWNLGGMQIPNWLVVLATATVAVLAWLNANGIWSAPAPLLFGLAGYAALHTVALGAVLGFGGGSVGFGLLLAVLAAIGMLVVLGQEFRRPGTDVPHEIVS